MRRCAYKTMSAASRRRSPARGRAGPAWLRGHSAKIASNSASSAAVRSAKSISSSARLSSARLRELRSQTSGGGPAAPARRSRRRARVRDLTSIVPQGHATAVRGRGPQRPLYMRVEQATQFGGLRWRQVAGRDCGQDGAGGFHYVFHGFDLRQRDRHGPLTTRRREALEDEPQGNAVPLECEVDYLAGNRL